jgi:glycosyltransferase involved in cell wall biosynthesis
MISLVVPIYNDGWLAKDFLERFKEVFIKYLNSEDLDSYVELIFVNDGSSNGSIIEIIQLSKSYRFVKVIDLSRNFGQHIALTAGYQFSKGDYVGMMNVDLQEDVSQFVKLVDFLKENPNYDFALGLREKRNDGVINKITSYLFHKTLNFLTGDNTPTNSSTVRAMSRAFLNAYLDLTEKDRYLPALENWLGFNHAYLPIIHTERKKGKSSYNFIKRLKMAVNAIITFSDKPIKIAVIIGFIITFLGFLMMFRLIIMKLFYAEMQPGYTSTLTLIIFFSGLHLMFLGLASIYIGKILREVQNRPLFIIKKTYNIQ